MSDYEECEHCSITRNTSFSMNNCAPAHVLWVGLSGKATKGAVVHKPLSSKTNSGKLIASIERSARQTIFYKTNVVKCAPITDTGKTRYPTTAELNCCYPLFTAELSITRPKIVFLLGKIVSDFLFKKLVLGSYSLDAAFAYNKYVSGNTCFIPVHHPSFIRVYRYKHIESYQQSLVTTIKSIS